MTALAQAVLQLAGGLLLVAGVGCLVSELYLRARGWRAANRQEARDVPRPPGRTLTREERARLAKLRTATHVGRYDPEAGDVARMELRAELERLHDTGASVRTLAEALGTAKSRAGQLLLEARRRTTGAAP